MYICLFQKTLVGNIYYPAVPKLYILRKSDPLESTFVDGEQPRHLHLFRNFFNASFSIALPDYAANTAGVSATPWQFHGPGTHDQLIFMNLDNLNMPGSTDIERGFLSNKLCSVGSCGGSYIATGERK